MTLVMEIQRQRQQHLAEACKRQGHVAKTRLPRSVAESIFAIDRIRTLYCVLGKVASTSWMQIMALASGKLPNSTDPRDLSWIHDGYKSARYLRRLSFMSPAAQRHRLTNYYKFVFVRHPLDRLVSAFREKFSVNGRYKHLLGPRIIRRYRKTSDSSRRVKFDEFAQFVLDERSRRREPLDRHWRPQFEMCAPCDVAYDFIGRYETLYDDATAVLGRLGIKSDLFPRDDRRWRRAAIRLNETMTALSNDTVQQLRQLYASDFELFGY